VCTEPLDDADVHAFDLCGALRRIRRTADLSQRELASAAGLSVSAVAHAEAGSRDLPVGALVRAAAAAGLRLALLDAEGREVPAMSGTSVRDSSLRRFPAHLDTRRSDENVWLYEPRRDRPETSFTFSRDRRSRDVARGVRGTPEDHHPDRPGDSPREREAARRREYWRERAAERERAFLAGELRHAAEPLDCACPAACEALDDYSGRPVHAPACPCRCDVG
jgi:transcriptional regulator with XRE-family HTH domain